VSACLLLVMLVGQVVRARILDAPAAQSCGFQE
jgi:hypothetical protein